MFLLAIVACIKALVAAECGVAGLATVLERNFVATATVVASSTAMKSSITVTTRGVATTSTTITVCSMDTDLLLLLLRLNSSLNDQQLGIEIMKRPRFCLSREGLDKWIKIHI
jgi:hypothetical protein